MGCLMTNKIRVQLIFLLTRVPRWGAACSSLLGSDTLLHFRNILDPFTFFCLSWFFFLFVCLMFIFERQRETEHEWGRSRDRGEQRERENPKQAPGSELSAQSPMWGLELMNLEIMT